MNSFLQSPIQESGMFHTKSPKSQIPGSLFPSLNQFPKPLFIHPRPLLPAFLHPLHPHPPCDPHPLHTRSQILQPHLPPWGISQNNMRNPCINKVVNDLPTPKLKDIRRKSTPQGHLSARPFINVRN